MSNINNYKLKILKKIEKELLNELENLNKLINCDPIIEILNLQKTAQKLLNELDLKDTKALKDFETSMNWFSKKEKYWQKIEKQRGNHTALFDKKFDLETELSEVQMQIYIVEKTTSK